MEIDDIRALIDVDLIEELSQSRRALMNLRFRAATMQLSDVTEISKALKRIARINTVIKERQLAKADK